MPLVNRCMADSPSSGDRIRLVVLTDITSLTAGVAEPDDGQSLIRLLLYANELDIEGFVASSNLEHGQSVRPDLIRQAIEAYGSVHENLLLHDSRYPHAAGLAKVVHSGQPIAGPKLPINSSIGEDKDTEGSEWFITVVDRPDPRPVWVLIWGGSADLAQALRKVHATRTKEELERFIAKLRILSISDQDSTGPWIRENFPGLFTVTQYRAYRGMYRSGDVALTSSEWVKTHIHGHGALGDLYPDYRGGDIWTKRLGPVRGIKEGDTPSVLALVPNGLGDLDQLWLGSWGGRFEGEGNHYTDVPDFDWDKRGFDTSNDPDPRMSPVYRWRPAFQADFQSRLDWCVRPYGETNHPPVVRIVGERIRQANVGEVVELDAESSTDPDGDNLEFAWSVYPNRDSVEYSSALDSLDSAKARLTVPVQWKGKTIPLLLTVTDQGAPRLTRYGRVMLVIE